MSRMIEMVGTMALAATLNACAADSDTTPPDDGLVSWTGTTAAAPLQTAVAGAEICADDPAVPCVVADAQGDFELRLPPETRQVVTVRADGYHPAIIVLTVGNEDQDSLYAPLIARDFAEAQVEDVGVVTDATKGTISFLVWNDNAEIGAAGATASTAPGNGEGPFFTSQGTLDPTAEETTGWGSGWFLNVEPGDYDVTIDGADCGSSKYDNDGNGTYTVPVRADAVTHVLCVLGE